VLTKRKNTIKYRNCKEKQYRKEEEKNNSHLRSSDDIILFSHTHKKSKKRNY